MNKDYYEHGDLYWVDLKPFFDSYVLMKIIDYEYFGPYTLSSKYVYVYDLFVKDITEEVPAIHDRQLYMAPFNFREFYIVSVNAFHYIKPERVNPDEIQYSYSIYNSLNKSEVWVINTRNGLHSYGSVFPYQNLNLFDFDELYSDHQIYARVIHEVFKNEDKEISSFELEENNDEIELDNIVFSPEDSYSLFLSNVDDRILNRPSYKSQKVNNLRVETINWDENYPEFDITKKSFDISDSENPNIKFEYGFSNSLIVEYKLLKPHFAKLNVEVSGGSVAALLFSIVYGENPFLNEIDKEKFKIAQKLSDSFILTFGNEKDCQSVMDFYKNEILNPEKIDFYMNLMDLEILEMYYKIYLPPRFGNLIRYATEESYLEILDKFRLAKDEEDYFGITINLEELRGHLGLNNIAKLVVDLIEISITKKYKVSEYELLENRYHIDVLLKDKVVTQKFFKFFKKSFKNAEAFKKILISLKIEVT